MTTTAPPPPATDRPRRSPPSRRLVVVVAVLAVVAAAVLVTTLMRTWSEIERSAPGPTDVGPPLPIPTDPTGPAAAERTAAGTGEPLGSFPVRWDVVRTGADDHQLVVYVDGGGCGTFRSEVRESADAVAVAIFPVAPGAEASCLVTGPSAIGVELRGPLGERALDGWRSTPGNELPGPLVVRGPDLATLTWPAGSTRATAEDLHRGLGADAYVWTQRFDGPAGDDGIAQSVSLEQWHGASPIDDGAAYQACRGATGSIEAAEVNGTEATLVRCLDDESPERRGALAILWMDGADRLMVRAESGNTELDAPGLIGLAESVRRGP